jgi:hypothetical protein
LRNIRAEKTRAVVEEAKGIPAEHPTHWCDFCEEMVNRRIGRSLKNRIDR